MMTFRTLCVVLLVLSKESCSQLNVCGNAPLNTKIVGGQNAGQGSWPWQVSLQVNGWHFCGGSLINNGWVLSAAHCFGSYTASQVTVVLELYAQGQTNSNTVSRSLSAVFKHPNYNSQTQDNDLSLLKMSSTVTFNNYINPICLAGTGTTLYNGTQVWVTGWGTTSYQGSLPVILQEVQVPIVGNRKCNCLYGVGSITNNMLCAGLLQGGKDSCQGDSGGPMVLKQGSQWLQVGIVSFGYECAQPNFPGVYTRVSQFQNWITQTVAINRPGFISYISRGNDGDLQANCPGLPTAPKISVVCGNANLNNISGTGNPLASAGTWPWMASLQLNGTHICGGTLIAAQYVMSSADCFSSSSSPSDWIVKLGLLNLNGSNPNMVSVNVTNITFSNTTNNNIAVLQLSTAPTLSNFIQPICVDQGNTNVTIGAQCWAAGWGSGGGAQQTLQQFNSNIVSCANGSSNSICINTIQLQQTDSGGPLMCNIGQSWYQVAVITNSSISIANSTSNSNSTTNSTSSSNSTTNSTSSSNSTTNSTSNSNSTTNSTSNSNSTTNSTNSSNSTMNSSSGSNSTTNSTSGSNSTSRSIRSLSDVLDRASNVQNFTRVSTFVNFLISTVGSLPSSVAVSSSSSAGSASSGCESLSVASFFLLTFTAFIQNLILEFIEKLLNIRNKVEAKILILQFCTCDEVMVHRLITINLNTKHRLSINN